MYEIKLEAMAFRIVRFLAKRKVGRLVEVKAQGFSIFGARTSLGYFPIVVTMACRTLQRLLASYRYSLSDRSTCLATLGSKELRGNGRCHNNDSDYKSPFHKYSN